MFPDAIDSFAVLLTRDVGKHVALEHVRWRASDRPTVVHGLKDRVGIVVGVSSDFDNMDVIEQPIDKVWQGLVRNLR